MCTNIKHTNEYWLCWFPGGIVSSSWKTGCFKTINVSLPSSGYWHLQAVCGISMVMLLCKALGKKTFLLLLWLWFWQQSLAYGCIVLLSGCLIIFSKSVSVCVHQGLCIHPSLIKKTTARFQFCPCAAGLYLTLTIFAKILFSKHSWAWVDTVWVRRGPWTEGTQAESMESGVGIDETLKVLQNLLIKICTSGEIIYNCCY